MEKVAERTLRSSESGLKEGASPLTGRRTFWGPEDELEVPEGHQEKGPRKKLGLGRGQSPQVWSPRGGGARSCANEVVTRRGCGVWGRETPLRREGDRMQPGHHTAGPGW